MRGGAIPEFLFLASPRRHSRRHFLIAIGDVPLNYVQGTWSTTGWLCIVIGERNYHGSAYVLYYMLRGNYSGHSAGYVRSISVLYL